MITTLTGQNHYLINKLISLKQDEYMSKYGDLAVEQLDCEEVEIDRITEAMQSLPFLVSNKLVILRSPSQNKKFVDVFPGLIDTIAENIEILIVEPKLDKRSTYYKALKTKTDFKEFSELDPVALAKWLVDETTGRGGRMDFASAKMMIDRVGIDQLRLSNELDKLLNYEPYITEETIKKLIIKSPQSTIFDLVDTAMRGNHEQSIRLYEEQRVQKVEPQQIIGMLAWQLQILALIKTSNGLSSAQIASDSKNNPYVISKSMKLAKRMTYEKIQSSIKKLLELDIAIKTTNVDPDLAVQGFIMQF